MSNATAKLALNRLEDRTNPVAVGALDPTFGTAGKVLVDAGGSDTFTAAAVQPDGKVVAVGGNGNNVVVVRLTTNGGLDPTFGTGGRREIDFGGADQAFAVTLDGGGRVVVAGSTSRNTGEIAVARLTRDGDLDAGFNGVGGMILNVSPGVDKAYAVAVDSSNRVVLAGVAFDDRSNKDIAVVRLTDAGQLDTTFGTNGSGTRVLFFGNQDNPVAEEARAVFAQPDGRIVLAGSTDFNQVGVASKDMFAVRLNVDGTVDDTFGDKNLNGVRAKVYDFGGTDTLFAAGRTPDGRFLLAGSTTNGNDMAVARLNADWSLDAGFNGTGLRRLDLGGTDVARGVYAQADGAVVVGGFTNALGSNDFAAVRLTADGQLDPTFNGSGINIFAVGGNDQALGLAQSPSGQPVLVGFADGEAAAARLTAVATPGGGAAVGGGGVAGLPTAILAGGGPNAVGVQFTGNAAGTGFDTPGQAGQLIPGFAGNVRVALADVNGDGTPDRIAGAGVGGQRVVVYDGRTNAVLADFLPFEASYTLGVYVAAGDINSDGRADLIVTPDQGGGARVLVFDGASLRDGTSAPRLVADFIGLADLAGTVDDAFRGGARVALGDVTGDGVPDLIVAAGFLGGPRVTIWDGASVAAANGGAPTAAPVANFFAFEDSLRNGAFVTAGDVTGDGIADLIFGGGPTGGPRVRVVDGAMVAAFGADFSLDDAGRENMTMGSFFAGDPNSRGGIRVAMRNLDGDTLADLVTGSGDGMPSEIRVYRGATMAADRNDPAMDQAIDPFGAALPNGVFVG